MQLATMSRERSWATGAGLPSVRRCQSGVVFRELGGECESTRMSLEAWTEPTFRKVDGVDMRLPSLEPRTEDQSSSRCRAEMRRLERKAVGTAGAGVEIRYGRLELGVGV